MSLNPIMMSTCSVQSSCLRSHADVPELCGLTLPTPQPRVRTLLSHPELRVKRTIIAACLVCWSISVVACSELRWSRSRTQKHPRSTSLARTCTRYRRLWGWISVDFTSFPSIIGCKCALRRPECRAARRNCHRPMSSRRTQRHISWPRSFATILRQYGRTTLRQGICQATFGTLLIGRCRPYCHPLLTLYLTVMWRMSSLSFHVPADLLKYKVT
jgi:hypothetical protein